MQKDVKEAYEASPVLRELMQELNPHRVSPWRPKLGWNDPPTIVEGLIQVTPELAAILLATRNTRNRPINKRKVEKLRNALIEDRWNPNLPDSTGIFGRDGQIQNFQHRLQACIVSGIPFVTRVELNHPRDILTYLDQTEPRTEAQQAYIIGRPRAEKTDYAAAKFLWQIDHQKTYFPFERATKTFQIIDRDYPKYIWHVVPPCLLPGTHLVYPIRASLLWLALYWREDVERFFSEVHNAQFSVPKSGSHHLFLYMNSGAFATEKQTYRGKWAMVRRTFKAFHLFQEGRSVERLRDSIDSVRKLRQQVCPNWAIVNEGPFDISKVGLEK